MESIAAIANILGAVAAIVTAYVAVRQYMR